MASCRSCGANIVWAITHGTEKPVPLEPLPVPHGNVVVKRDRGGNLIVRPLAPGEENPTDGVRGQTHFATCPNADSHRRRKA